MVDGTAAGAVMIDPEELLRSALEKIVYFECRVSQLEKELEAARAVAERARADAAVGRRRDVELSQEAVAERGARADAVARAEELAERVRLLEGERERLLSGLVDRARVAGAPGSSGGPAAEEGGADLAGFIAELRAEIVALRGWKAAAEAQGFRGAGQLPAPPRVDPAEPVARVANRFDAAGRVGLNGRDVDQMKGLLATRADRVLYERALDDLRAPDARVRVRAVRTLEALGSKAAAPLLAAALGREADAEVKAAVLGALGRFQEPFAAELAARALEDARPAVRVAAIDALAAVAQGAAEERLAAALRDPSPLVRRRAALHLGFAPGDRAEASLAAALGDPDRGVARAAAAALSGRPTARAQGALARALEHPDASVRRAAGQVLGRIAGEVVDTEGPAPARRAAARRIAERLARMDGAAIRDAVIAGATAPARPSTGSGRAEKGPLVVSLSNHERAATATATATSKTTASGTSTATAARPSTSSGRADHAVPARPAPARAAVAVLVQQAAVAAGDDLEDAILGEVRAALRGCTPETLATALGQPLQRIAQTLAALSGRGALVLRGTRWFTT
jgi:HEAT repeat protein